MTTLLALKDRLLRFEPTARVLDHWLARQELGALRPFDFDPVAVPSVLPFVYLLERLGDRLRYRVSGEEVNRLFGSNHTGLHLDEVVPPEVYPVVAPYFLRVFDPALCIFKGRVVLPDRDYLEFERVLMPVRHNGRLHLLGCLALSGGSPLRRDGIVVEEIGPGFDFTVFDLATGAVEHDRVEAVPVLPRTGVWRRTGG